MVKNQLVEVQCRQDGCDAGRQGGQSETKGGQKRTPSCDGNILITVCSSVVGRLVANPFKTSGEIKITSARLRIINSSLQHKDKKGAAE